MRPGLPERTSTLGLLGGAGLLPAQGALSTAPSLKPSDSSCARCSLLRVVLLSSWETLAGRSLGFGAARVRGGGCAAADK